MMNKVGKKTRTSKSATLAEQDKSIDSLWLAELIGAGNDYTRRGIAAKVSELIYTGEIAIGSKLPSTRALANVLGVSQATISGAWSILRKQRVITGERRQGAWVCGLPGPYPERVHSIGFFDDDMLDLTWSVSSPELVQDVYKAMHRGPITANLHSHQRDSIIPELESQVRSNWFYPAEAFLTAEDIFEGSSSIFGSLLLPGSAVAIEVPAPLYLLDQLDHINAKIIPIGVDSEGPILEDLEQALQQNPAAFLYHPNLYAFREYPVSKERSLAMAEMFHDSQNYLYVIEYDMLGGLIATPVYSIGNHLPERTLYICSYAAYGGDMRFAIVSGPQKLISKLHAYRDFNYSASNRILQGALAWMMQDKETQQVMAHGRTIYWQRSQAMADALVKLGFIPRQGILSLWLQVPDEQYVVASLAKQGIIVLPGSCSGVKGDYIRVSTSLLQPELVSRVADAIASACRSSPVKEV